MNNVIMIIVDGVAQMRKLTLVNPHRHHCRICQNLLLLRKNLFLVACPFNFSLVTRPFKLNLLVTH